MNRIILLLLAITTPMWLQAQPPPAKPVTLKGSLKGFTEQPEYILFYYTGDGRKVPDTAKVINGQYTWQGKIDAPARFLLTARYSSGTGGKKNNAVVFLEPGNQTITHTDSFSNRTVKGSQAHLLYEQLQAKDEAYGSTEGKHLTPEQIKTFLRDKEEAVYGVYARQHPQSPLAVYVLRMYGGGYFIDGNKVDSLYHQLPAAMRATQEGQRLFRDIETGKVLKMQREAIPDYIRLNPSSPAALNALEKYAGYSIDATVITPLFALLSDDVKQSADGKKFAARLNAASQTAIGKPAPLFTQNDTAGKPFSLTSLRGQYVLIDFWASWCKPCRAENPNVVAAFNRYKEKGFTVLGVSLEQPNAQQVWMKAIHTDGLTWHHVSDFRYWENEVAVLYGIKAVPQNLLINPQGIIIGKNLYGKKLDQKLEEIYK